MEGPVTSASPPGPVSPEDTDNTNKFKVGGVVAAAVIVGAIIFAIITGSDEDEACKLSGAAVSLIALAVHEGNTAQAVIGSTALTPICKEIVKVAVETPQAPIETKIILPHLDQTTEYEGSGQALSERFSAPIAQAAPSSASAPVNARITRFIECSLAYGSHTLEYNRCMAEAGFEP